MPAESPTAGPAPRPVVFLPCHTLDDFPSWLDDREADDLLAAWIAPWHPGIVAAAGAPRWASLDLPPPQGPFLGIVPASWDGRFAAQFDVAAAADARLVRATTGRAALAAAALDAAVGNRDGTAANPWAEDFAALGLAVLLAELLARRMRTEADLESTGFETALVTAAAAAVAGRDDDARAGLAECFRCLEAARARYYPVDAWLVDLVLVAATTPGPRLREEWAAGVPVGLVADGPTLAVLAARDPDLVAAVQRGVADGTLGLCGGPCWARPLDACTPEDIVAALVAGSTAWLGAVDHKPAVFARHGGGGSAALPQVLAGLGFEGALWSSFDGAPLPDPGAGRILWQGMGEAAIEAIARPPLDARSAAALLALPQRLGDAMDHDHVAVVTLAHHAGNACEWHALMRRIGRWSNALGTFVTPDELFRRTSGGGTPVSFGPDAFPPTPLPEAPCPETPDGDPVAAAVAAAEEAARPIVARAAELRTAVPAVPATAAPAAAAGGAPVGIARSLFAWWSGSRRDDPELVLASESIRVEVHPETGGILSLRRPGAGPNRLSQQLAPRRGDGYGRMRAESIGRGPTASGSGIVTRGLLVDVDGREAGTFVQGLSLVAGQPLVAVDVEVRMHQIDAPGGRLADRHVACRFAWHENEDVEIRRSIHAQAVTTERTRFTAPHFVEIVPAGPRGTRADALTILCGGLPWHVRSSPHVLDTILAGAAGTAHRRLAAGIGLERPWDAALEFLAGVAPGSGPRPGPANVRVTVHDVEVHGGRVARARVGLLESAGSAGRVRVEWAGDVVAAAARELDGRPRPDAAVAIEGRAIVVSLRAHEWLVVDLEFGA